MLDPVEASLPVTTCESCDRLTIGEPVCSRCLGDRNLAALDAQLEEQARARLEDLRAQSNRRKARG